MPTYDFRCQRGHMTEASVSRDTREIRCACGVLAERMLAVGVGLSGFRATPTSQARIPLNRFLEAHGEIVESSRKAGVEPPDLWQAAKDRIKRGDVKAID